MGTEREEYLVLGVNIGCGDMIEEEYEAMEEACEAKCSEIEVIRDGLNGGYCVVGMVLAKGDEFDGTPFTEINITPGLEAKVKWSLNRVLPPHFSIQPKLFAFTHWR